MPIELLRTESGDERVLGPKGEWLGKKSNNMKIKEKIQNLQPGDTITIVNAKPDSLRKAAKALGMVVMVGYHGEVTRMDPEGFEAFLDKVQSDILVEQQQTKKG